MVRHGPCHQAAASCLPIRPVNSAERTSTVQLKARRQGCGYRPHPLVRSWAPREVTSRHRSGRTKSTRST